MSPIERPAAISTYIYLITPKTEKLGKNLGHARMTAGLDHEVCDRLLEIQYLRTFTAGYFSRLQHFPDIFICHHQFFENADKVSITRDLPRCREVTL